MYLVETISKNEFPTEFHANYDTKGMHNIQQNFFEETPDGKTKWISKCEFIPTGFMMKIMTTLMPSAFKKQSKKYMIDFKNFADDTDIRFWSDDGSGSSAIYFRLDGSQATASQLITRWDDNSRIAIGSSNDLQLYHKPINYY